ncbi:MAG TPA: trypsin-like peptidase domain-containing protein [Pyrinomonadaceae bacterium]|nr:trypsin-like peptidase domain-containing protein [Pyrinomonadaceae bacterium]
MYQLSARRIAGIALLSAVFTALILTLAQAAGARFQVAGAAAEPAAITDPSVATEERNNIEVYRAAAPGVAFITSSRSRFGSFESQGRAGTGSGSVIDSRGHILTNDHVVANVQSLRVSLGGEKTYPATVVGRDPDTDLAVIKIDAPASELTIIPMGDSERLVVGQKVLAIGNPFGLDRTLTTGVISGLQRPIRARNGRQIEGAIQTDASINPGNSGGPLLDSRGRMIGINSQILSTTGASSGVGFAVPVSIARRVVPQLISAGYVNRPRLGVRTRSVESLRGQARLPVAEGVVVLEVIPGGSAEAAGLRGMGLSEESAAAGDIITAIDGERVKTGDDLTRLLDRRNVGDVVRVEVFRNGRSTTIPVRLLAERR